MEVLTKIFAKGLQKHENRIYNLYQFDKMSWQAHFWWGELLFHIASEPPTDTGIYYISNAEGLMFKLYWLEYLYKESGEMGSTEMIARWCWVRCSEWAEVVCVLNWVQLEISSVLHIAGKRNCDYYIISSGIGCNIFNIWVFRNSICNYVSILKTILIRWINIAVFLSCEKVFGWRFF